MFELLPGLLVQPFHVLNVPDIPNRCFPELFAEGERILDRRFDIGSEDGNGLFLFRVQRKLGQLFQLVQTEQTVAGAQVVVEKAEGSALGQRYQPDGKFGQLNGQWIQVDTIQTFFRHQTPGDQQTFVQRIGHRLGAACRFENYTVHGDEFSLTRFLAPRFDQPFGQPAADLNEKGSGAHGRVTDFQVQQFGG